VLLDEQIVAIERAFSAAGLPHAFGGAQALGYYGDVRATHDIDVNVFVGAEEAPRVLSVLATIGVETAGARLVRQIERDGQTRLFWDGTPLDLFFSYDPLHESAMGRRRRVDFFGDPIHVLSAEDLIVFKATFDREKDWRDIAGVLFASEGAIDHDYVREWIGRIDGPDGPRSRRLEQLITSGGRNLGA